MNRNILVTGASQGLGYQIARRHLTMGDRVFALVIVHSEELTALEKQYGEKLSILFADISNTDSVELAGERVKAAVSSLDILYNNAGVYSFQDKVPLEETDPDRFLWYYNVNAVGPVRVMKAMLPLLGKGSVVISISSEAGSIAQCRRFREYGYCMSKAALNMAVRIFGIATQEKGIRSLAIHPGWMQTTMGGAGADHPPEESAERIVDIALHVDEIPEEHMYMDRDQILWQW